MKNKTQTMATPCTQTRQAVIQTVFNALTPVGDMKTKCPVGTTNPACLALPANTLDLPTFLQALSKTSSKDWQAYFNTPEGKPIADKLGAQYQILSCILGIQGQGMFTMKQRQALIQIKNWYLRNLIPAVSEAKGTLTNKEQWRFRLGSDIVLNENGTAISVLLGLILLSALITVMVTRHMWKR